jgi:superfamily II DNA or RNA helicase
LRGTDIANTDEVVELARRAFKKRDAVVIPDGQVGLVDVIVDTVADHELFRSYQVLMWNRKLGRWAAHASRFTADQLRPATAEQEASLPRPTLRHVTAVQEGDWVTLVDGRKAAVVEVIRASKIRVLPQGDGVYAGRALEVPRGEVAERSQWPESAVVRLGDGRVGRLSSTPRAEAALDGTWRVLFKVKVWSPDAGVFDAEPTVTEAVTLVDPTEAIAVPPFDVAVLLRERRREQEEQAALRHQRQLEREERAALRQRRPPAVARPPSGTSAAAGPPPSFWRGVQALFLAPTQPVPLARPAPPTAPTAESAQPASPALPLHPGPLAAEFDQVAFAQPFRRYQLLALDAFEAARSQGRRRLYLVMPPGSGKTAVGLEIARRLGRPTLALGPNTAIQAQWLAQWRDFHPQSIPAGDSPSLTSHVTALTYQAICNLEAHSAALDDVAMQAWHASRAAAPDEPDAPSTGHDQADLAHFRQRARRLAMQGGDHDHLLALLHPNGRALLERIKAGGQWTIVLDECHHLLEMWGHLVRAIMTELGERVFLVGLTATPPAEMDTREAALYEELFGHADLEVPTPAVVKEGNLAPYRDLAYLTTPLGREAEYIQSEGIRFLELTTELMSPSLGTISFPEWLNLRVVERPGPEGVQVGWPTFERDSPELAQAAVRFHVANEIELPPGARLREAYRQPLSADDWVVMINDYAMGHLRQSSDLRDLAAWENIRKSLPAVGYALTRTGVRSYVSPTDRVLLLSGAKAVAALDILAAEEQALGAQLRALLLCDFEAASAELSPRLQGVIGAQAGSAARLLQTLVTQQPGTGLDPILVTGRTVACSRLTAPDLCRWLESEMPELTGGLRSEPAFADFEDMVSVEPVGQGWRPSRYVPAVTRFFEVGRSRCLIGTRGLLGEGWDAPCVNVLIDLTGVTTTTSVHQMRGRSLRLDLSAPLKVAHNWDVVCVAPDHPKGAADYGRFVRKHRAYYSITETGEIESGVSHVDPVLSPFTPPAVDDLQVLNARMLDQAEDRDRVHDLWRIGEPYRNVPIGTVRIHCARNVGLPAQRWLRPTTDERPRPRAGHWLATGAVAAVTIFVIGLVAGAALAGVAAALVVATAAGYGAGRSLRSDIAYIGPSDTLGDVAAALAESLSAAGLVSPPLGATSVRVRPQPDGYYRCYLEGASQADSKVFTDALDELLGPLNEPRYIVPRFMPDPPRSAWSALWRAIRQAGGEPISGAVAYHTVPGVLASSQVRAAIFGEAWNRYVSRGRLLSADEPEGQAVIETLSVGRDDSFATDTQMRTLWQ